MWCSLAGEHHDLGVALNLMYWGGGVLHPSVFSTGARQPWVLRLGLSSFVLGLHMPYTLDGIMVGLELHPKLSLAGLASFPILTVG